MRMDGCAGNVETSRNDAGCAEQMSEAHICLTKHRRLPIARQ